jgi:hypothetical protein
VELKIIYSVNSIDEANRITRSWFYWPRILLQGAYGLLLGAAICFVVAGYLTRAMSHTDQPSRALTGCLAAALFVTVLALFYRRAIAKRGKLLAGMGSANLSVNQEGIGTVDEKGVKIFSPWSTYSSFREGRAIFLLKMASLSKYWPIPKECLTQNEVALLRSLLASQLPEHD